jgi:hypothetical protein
MPRAKVYSDIEAEVIFDTVKEDYGVERSPVWDAIADDTMRLESLHMFGREWSEREMRVTFGDFGTDAFLGLVFDQVEDWEDD